MANRGRKKLSPQERDRRKADRNKAAYLKSPFTSADGHRQDFVSEGDGMDYAPMASDRAHYNLGDGGIWRQRRYVPA